MDKYSVDYHNTSTTHLDALSHMFTRGKTYNGYSQQEISKQGAKQLAVTAYKTASWRAAF